MLIILFQNIWTQVWDQQNRTPGLLSLRKCSEPTASTGELVRNASFLNVRFRPGPAEPDAQHRDRHSGLRLTPQNHRARRGRQQRLGSAGSAEGRGPAACGPHCVSL